MVRDSKWKCTKAIIIIVVVVVAAVGAAQYGAHRTEVINTRLSRKSSALVAVMVVVHPVGFAPNRMLF